LKTSSSSSGPINRSRIREQQFDEGVEEGNVGVGRLQGKRVDARAILAYPVDPASVELDQPLS